MRRQRFPAAMNTYLQALRAAWPIVLGALRRGQLFRPACILEPAHPDILASFDVPVAMADGTVLTASVFRSRRAAEHRERVPVVMCAHPYDNRLVPALGRTPLGGPPHQYRLIRQRGRPVFSVLTSWEAPDPNFWVPAGYAVVNLNLPGYASSGGRPSIFSRHQATCFGEAIEWAARQEWSTGAVGLSGVSYLAISQYMVAAGQGAGGVPPALRAISPWEGVSDLYRDLLYEGGVAERGFPPFWFHTEIVPALGAPLKDLIEEEGDPRTMVDDHPFLDEYWESKTPSLADIRLPMLVCASFSDQGLHTRGSFRAFRMAASTDKWLYTHRDLKWDVYYDREVQELTRRFFDRFVKREPSEEFLSRAPVRLEVRSARDVVHEVRDEHEWPLARTDYRRLYLDGGAAALVETNPSMAHEIGWSATRGSWHGAYRFAEGTELTGYMKLRLRFEARGSGDATIFAAVRKRDARGRLVPFYGSVGNDRDAVTRGLLRASRRGLDAQRSTDWEPVLDGRSHQPLAPGEIATLDVALQPSSTWFAAGESLELVVSARPIAASAPFRKEVAANRGVHVVHAGGGHESYLLVPVVPARAPAPRRMP